MMKMCGVMLMVIMTGMVITEALRDYENSFEPPVAENEPEYGNLETQLTPLLQKEREYLDQRITQLTNEGGDIDQRLRQMETRLEERFNTNLAEKIHDLQIKLEGGLARMVVEIKGVETRVEARIEAAETKIEEARVDIINQLAGLASHEELMQVKSDLAIVVLNSTRQVTKAMEDLVTIEKLEEVLVAKLEVVREGCSRCGQQDTLAQVSAAVTNVQDHFSLLGQQLNTTLSSCSQGCEAIGVEVARLGDEGRAAADVMNQGVNRVEQDLGYIQISLDHIYNFTQPAPEVIEEEPPQTPCEDSTFVMRTINVCEMAVKHRKCGVLSLAYHCCRTCHTAGQIPEDGPWRYVTYPRQVNHIQIFQLMTTQNSSSTPAPL